ncbi:Ig domain protein group 2 domain protein [Bacillus methanolicus PB1]|uniref:Ig domain protein group 2 domain protein n=1 Tax=Bacillus methanolicus PB1 TaxID=997296 RepID=I3DXT4_BACMT|nr:Ig-like domain-containing protein [Bacillus methanolicus]EIJ79055.1 Ig domain protein group 2 domain protein [Bacillus methanolicus PB1]
MKKVLVALLLIVFITACDSDEPSLKGNVSLQAVNPQFPPENLIKFRDENSESNRFKLLFSLEPIEGNKKGKLSDIKIFQPLPDGIKLADIEDSIRDLEGLETKPSVSEKIVNGKRTLEIVLNNTIAYDKKKFTPDKIGFSVVLQADWALQNVSMPKAEMEFTDSRNGKLKSSLSPPPRSQIINMKVRLTFPDYYYEGDSSGMISYNSTNYGAQTKLLNQPVKSMVKENDYTIKITYANDETANLYLQPDFTMKNSKTNQILSSGSVTDSDVIVNLSRLVPGENVKYFYRLNNEDWKQFSQGDSISVTKYGTTVISVKSEGGFSLPENIMTKTITIEKRIESITVQPNPIEIETGKTAAFTVNIHPSDATNQDLDFEIGDETIAEFTEANRILGKTEGETELVVRTKDGSNIVVTVQIKVKDPYIPLEELKFKKTVFKIGLGEKIPLTDLLIFNPDNATQKNIVDVVTEMKNKVQVIEENGKWYVIGKEIGYSTVTATAEKQRNGNQPQASVLFEVITNSNDDEDDGPPGAGRW